ncbi:gamma-tubulin complex subunit SPC72 KNAG_0E04130 [Huiozyma naganishii CBS 8797]|uniref:Mto2p-binding domain-containing protein n=1 Tax=Huiozyma naganishii (strain ATCC MYA-139 / BCRC 22969 / CBS 8797 / KCTC 17520 / NBRC 10181 / NCYC 3082 / Yp74L-3) TaxID=1071383 RepID=J7S833_HUIN7|nr:hypothetical protein KNAG_0E04130 [Kazachstania naganishii CBS 8797]CCK70666.1 hypothetical protein KNAG_0E04130 [Kazachstania naganishii CBS 8797]
MEQTLQRNSKLAEPLAEDLEERVLSMSLEEGSDSSGTNSNAGHNVEVPENTHSSSQLLDRQTPDGNELEDYESRDESNLKNLSVPTLKEQMTPWRQNNRATANTDGSPIERMDKERGGFPFLGMDKFSIKQTVSDKDLSILQHQLRSSKLRISSLEEIVKGLNTGEFNMTLFDALRKQEARHEIDVLKTNLSKKQSEISELEKQLELSKEECQKLRQDNLDTVEMAEEQLKNWDEVSHKVDFLIADILHNGSHFTEQEAQELNAAKELGHELIIPKLNALGKVIHQSLPQEDVIANSTQLDAKNYITSDEQIGSQMEIEIEQLHKGYEGFIRVISTNLDKSAILEDELKLQLDRQQQLIDKIYAETSIETKRDKSHISNVKSLQELISTLQRTIREKDQEIAMSETKYQQSEGAKKLKLQNAKLNKELVDLKNLEETNQARWEELVTQLEDELRDCNAANSKLADIIKRMSQDISGLQQANERLTNETTDRIEQAKEIQKLAIENESLRSEIRKLELPRKTFTQQRDLEFHNFRQSLLLHLTNVFEVLKRVIKRQSIDQSMKKISTIQQFEGISNLRNVQSKFESLYNFIETALDAVVESYMNLVLDRSDESSYSRQNDESDSSDYQLRVKELQRKWLAERERRKLDSNAAELRIQNLETEAELLRNQLNGSHRSSR